jgi:nucleoside-diphosphate-sugar epimerase
LTGWQPRVGLHRGIEQTWRWLMAQPQAGRTSSLSA